MNLTGLHFLLTYKCNLECAHCFVWGSPQQNGTMTLTQISEILRQSKQHGTVAWIYFEGGEPFLYYPILLKAVQMAAEMGFQVGIVSNGYWATSEADALEWLSPMSGLVADLSISSDFYHWDETLNQHAIIASAAADQLNIPIGLISVAQPNDPNSPKSLGQIQTGESAVMYRGRAANKLAGSAALHAWNTFDECLNEDLIEPGRVHVDPFGNVHICQGIVIGNLFETSLQEICSSYDPKEHAITEPLLTGGPHELVLRYDLTHEAMYADACHLCDHSRRQLRTRFPTILKPDQMYLEPK